jgi:hypothetical protein
MKIAWGVLTGDARGKVGGVCAQLSRSGPILRGMTRGKTSSSADQLQQRAALATPSQLWRSLTMAPYRADWILLAANNPELDVFGNLITKTGSNWFCRCNKNRATFGLDAILPAPALAAVGDPGTLTANHVTSPADEIELVATQDPAPNEAVIIKATRPLSQGRLCIGNTARQIAALAAGTTNPWYVLSEYTAKFHAPITDMRIIVQVWYVDIDQGRPGLTATASVIW